MAAQAVSAQTRSGTCTGVSIIADGLAAAEAILAAEGDTNIKQIIATTPCYVPDYLSSGKEEDARRRVL